jgi:hypothetical protein
VLYTDAIHRGLLLPEHFVCLCRCVMLCCTQMLSTEEVDRSSPPAEEPSMLPRSQLVPACVNPSTLWRSRLQRTLLEVSTVCSTRSVAMSLRRCSDQVRLLTTAVCHCCTVNRVCRHLIHGAATDIGRHVIHCTANDSCCAHDLGKH